jgi:drug/metabolite transporter (DMT)-like permease
MPAVFSMSLCVIIWSLYPLVASLGLETIGGLEMLLIVLVISSISSLLISVVYLTKKGILRQAIEIQNNLPSQAYVMAILAGVTGIFCHIFLFWALSLSHKGGVALLYDSWPIFALIATPFLMKKQWKQVSFKEFLISLIALFGVALIVLSDEKIDINLNSLSLQEDFDFKIIGGYILAFVGGYMVALVSVAQGAFAEYFKDLNNDFGATLISQIWSRTLSVILAIIVYIAFAEPHNDLTINWLPILFIGIGVLVFGSALFSYSLLKANTPTINIMYYFVPVLAVFWLWLAGESTINLGIIIGGTIIFLSNIYLFIAGRKAPLEQDL